MTPSRRPVARAVAATLVAAAALLPSGGCMSWFVADPAALRDSWNVQPALEKSGANRGEIVKFLDHYDGAGDGDAARAAVFLVENMPGRGYVIFGRKDAKGADVEFDPLKFKSFAEAQAALDVVEKEHGTLEDVKARFVPDLETVTADFLIRHVDRSLATWRALPDAERPPFETFLDFVLPYRGSEEPLEDWLTPLQDRLSALRAGLPAGASRADLWKAFQGDLDRRARFDEIYYLHPTDQSFSEITRTGMGRCEDLSNLQTFYARAFGRATACDYTPAWGHRDNNHAWTVDLDARGEGRDRGQSHAAKIYRKTFSLHPGLAALLPPGREAPNRWVASRAMIDVTAQYGNAADVRVDADVTALGDEPVAYLCVFNGGEWVAIAYAKTGATPSILFPDMGRGLLYLSVVHDGTAPRPIAPPLVLAKDGVVRSLAGRGGAVSVTLTATMPEQTSADTGATTPVSHLKPGASYTLSRWDGEWKPVESFTASAVVRRADGLAADGLYWLVEDGSRRLERPFTVEGGRQRFW